MKTNWQREVENFREWAATQDQQEIEWETDYGEEKWQVIYRSVGEFLSASNPLDWTTVEIEDLLYLLARDIEVWLEMNYRLRENPVAAMRLASKSLSTPDIESVSRQQLAEILGHLPSDERIEPLLLHFASDGDEPVRRFALQALARIHSSHTEEIAFRAWHHRHENQQWARMMALVCWQHVASPLLEAHLREAEISPWCYLSDFAYRLRHGDVVLE